MSGTWGAGKKQTFRSGQIYNNISLAYIIRHKNYVVLEYLGIKMGVALGVASPSSRMASNGCPYIGYMPIYSHLLDPPLLEVASSLPTAY